MFGSVDTGKGWHSQVCPRVIGSITTYHKIIHSMSVPTVTHICMRELPHFHHSPTSSQVDQDSSVPLAKCSFRMIPLSRHSVDRSPRVFHSSTHYAVRASWFSFEVLSVSVESRKTFLDGSLCLAGRCPWSGCIGSSSWRQRSALLATFRRMCGAAVPASAFKQGIG